MNDQTLPKAVIFDMDGVLIDAREWHYRALNDALSIFGYSIPRDQHEAHLDGLPTKTKLNILSSETDLPTHLHEIISAVKQERTLRIAYSECRPTLQHLLLIGSLKAKGSAVGVATNSIRATAETMLSLAGLRQSLDVLTTNEDVQKPKPDPEIYLSTATALNLDPHELVVVEDNDHGYQAAMEAGCKVIRVSDPYEVSLDLWPKMLVKPT